MERYKKRYIKNAVIIPIIVAVLVSALFFTVFYVVSGDFPSMKEGLVLASYDSIDVGDAEELEVENHSISREKISNLYSNATFGTISIDSAEYPLIYDANEVNAMGKFNMDITDTVIGDVGTAYLACYKSDSKNLKAVKKGDQISVKTNYGSFTYEVIKTVSADESALAHIGDGLGKALVIYTDNSNSAGISDEYFCAVCQFSDGTQITH